MGGVDNIPMSVKNQTNSVDLHEEGSILTQRSDKPSIFNTLKKISLQEICMNSMYQSFMMTFMLIGITRNLIFFQTEYLWAGTSCPDHWVYN